MVDPSSEVDLWGLERIISREVNVEEKYTTGKGRLIRSHNSSLPVHLVLIVDRAGGAVSRRVFTKVDKFLLNSFQRSHNYLVNLKLSQLIICNF